VSDGPRLTVDAEAAERARARLDGVGEGDWPRLAPIFAASPYLAGLAVRRPEQLARALATDPVAHAAELARIAGGLDGDAAEVGRRLRELKAELHLALALADLQGVIDLDAVTLGLSEFADAALRAALLAVAREQAGRGRLAPPSDPANPVPGLFALAMGKHGARELNYSSDIDISVFYEPTALPVTGKVDAQTLAVQVTQALASLMQNRTADGYVFRVDLRLRPDPGSTPSAVPVEAALEYYESVGQNWERAAFIKARPVAGDLRRAADFLEEMQPFVWRRNLDYAAIADIQSIKRQIHVHKGLEGLTAPGHDLKLGSGGIREIEFYVQTQQLILGGRAPHLRSPRTLDALEALRASGHVSHDAAADLTAAYVELRGWEHRVQMVADEQTHRLPEADADRLRVAALAGFGDLATFDAAVESLLARVNGRYGELFAAEEPLSSFLGSLIFTGVEDDPETLRTLARMGFSRPAHVSETIRGWHAGRIAATRTARGRELFTRLAPRLLEAMHATGAPNAAFARFDAFFRQLSSGVQIQSLFLAQPRLFELLVEVMAFAPSLATTLARRPAALDALLDGGFFDPLTAADIGAPLRAAVARADGFEAAMDAARRVHREQAFRIGVQVISGAARAEAAGAAWADLADACIEALAPAALAETERLGGAFPGEVAVVALGKAGSREMTARSDLDLLALYRAAPGAASARKGWAAETFYGRFTGRLVAALSAPTAEGGLYEVDLRLRPSGAKGPVAVSFAAFESYHAGDAATWEHLALTRARVVWGTSDAFAAEAAAAVESVLRQPRDPSRTAADVREMRALMARERPARAGWDLKLSPGGLVDVEFAAQHLQLVGAAAGGPLRQNTGAALAALRTAGLAEAGALKALMRSWRLCSALSQLLKLALEDDADPAREPERLKALLARAGGAPDYDSMVARLAEVRAKAHEAFEAVVGAATA
jgi:glutamate-ammonia-ligase adenylyltransferase